MARRGAHLQRPFGHTIGLIFLLRRLRHQFELRDAGGAVAVGGADAVVAGVAAADHDDVLAFGRNHVDLVARVHLVLQRQEFHRVVHAGKLATRHRQIARVLAPPARTTASNSACSAAGDRLGGVVAHAHRQFGVGDHHPGAEHHPFVLHLRDATVDVRLLHLEIRDAVAQRATDAAGLLEHGHGMPDARAAVLLRALPARSRRQRLSCRSLPGAPAAQSSLLPSPCRR